jgi:hypothetical protein
VTDEGDVMRGRCGPFWDGVEGQAAATLGCGFIDADVETGTIEVAFPATARVIPLRDVRPRHDRGSEGLR